MGADGMGRGEESASAGPGDPPLTVAAVARRLAVAPATLRTWDRSRAAMSLDARATTVAIRAQLERHGVLHTWECVLRPLLVAVVADLPEAVDAIAHPAAG